MSRSDRQPPYSFFEGSAQEADHAIYSGGQPASDLADPRLIASPTPIERIWADVKQPRRAVPASIRMHWNGDPEDVADLLGQWHTIAQSRIDAFIAAKQAEGHDLAPVLLNIVDVLMGRGDGIEVPSDAPPIFNGYLDLLRLAQSIHQEGLIHPITVMEQPAAGRFLIETGERRWLAYWLLYLNMGEFNWAKIPAIRSDGRDYVWRQAQENTARRQLNAIGMARQLALLIMASRTGLDGVQYDEYDHLVLPGGCDRRYYAQVANGNLHRIPKGSGERIQAAMGLSMTQLSQYRRLLQLTDDDQVNDAIWVRADVEDWPELPLRQAADTLTVVKVREMILAGDDWTLDDLRRLTPPPPAPREPEPVPHFTIHDRVLHRNGLQGTVMGTGGRMVSVKLDRDKSLVSYYAVDLTLVDRKQAPEPVEPPPLTISYEVGEAVEYKHTGAIGKVLSTYRSKDGQQWVVCDFDGLPDNKRPDEIMQLGMGYEEYIEQELESDPGVSFDPPEMDLPEEEEPPQSPARPQVVGMPNHPTVPVGLSEYYDGPKSAPPPAPVPKPAPSTNKADSPSSDPHSPIIRRDNHRRALLQYWQGIAVMRGDDPTQRAIESILTMTPDQAHKLADKGELEATMNAHYDQIWGMMRACFEGPFTELLELISQVGNER